MVEKKEKILDLFSKESLILTTHGLDIISECNIPLDEIINEAKERGIWLVTHEFIEEFVLKRKDSEGKKIVSCEIDEEKLKEEKELIKIEEDIEEQIKERGEKKDVWTDVLRPSKKIIAKEIESRLVIDWNSDVTGKSSCSGKIEDFLDYFNKKYENQRNILLERHNLRSPIQINRVKNYKGENLSIICMIKDKRESKKGYKFLEVEDTTGETTVLLPKDDNKLSDTYERLLPDEVIGISGVVNANNLFIASEIFEPELPVNNMKNTSTEPVNIALISDTHVGSYLFLESEFEKFIDWLNLKGEKRDVAEKIKYLLIAGDLVDGIGIYPNQEKELSIPDIYKQYDFLADLLGKIPKYIEIILTVGNHDAVRVAEPQPALSKEIAPRLYEMENVHLLGNPARISVHGVNTLMYHGTSMDTIIGNLANCSYQRPETTMIEYLKKRYLVPTYGNDALSPEKEDYLSIKEIPDIFHCGHVHTNGYANYRGVTIINSGTFQGRTKYQEQLGHVPTPARVPIVDLQSYDVSVVHF